MQWIFITCALFIAFLGIIMLKIELYYLSKKSSHQWVLLEKEHIKLGELALNITTVLKYHDVRNTKTYKNVLICQQHLKSVNTIWDKFQVYRTMLITLKHLIDITKDYPECRVNNVFLQIVQDIYTLETTITKLCLKYNYFTQKYNNTIQTFPIYMFSKLLKIKEKNII